MVQINKNTVQRECKSTKVCIFLEYETANTSLYTNKSSQLQKVMYMRYIWVKLKSKGSPYSIPEHSVPELIPVLCSQPAGEVSHKPGGRLSLLSARPAVTPITLKRAAW